MNVKCVNCKRAVEVYTAHLDPTCPHCGNDIKKKKDDRGGGGFDDDDDDVRKVVGGIVEAAGDAIGSIFDFD